MKVNFKFGYVLTLHDRNVYRNAIEQDGVDEEVAYNLSKVKVNKRNIKDITKSSDGSAVIMFKNKFATVLKTLEEIPHLTVFPKDVAISSIKRLLSFNCRFVFNRELLKLLKILSP